MKNKLKEIENIEFIDVNDQKYILGGNINQNIQSIDDFIKTIYYPDNNL